MILSVCVEKISNEKTNMRSFFEQVTVLNGEHGIDICFFAQISRFTWKTYYFYDTFRTNKPILMYSLGGVGPLEMYVSNLETDLQVSPEDRMTDDLITGMIPRCSDSEMKVMSQVYG